MRPIDLAIKRVVHAENVPADTGDRTAVATYIVELERENAKLREALKHFKVDLTTLSGSGHAYTVLATGQKQLREALG